VAGRDVLSLFDEHDGSIALPKQWTDLADPSPYDGGLEQPPILHVACLVKLIELVEPLKQKD
jgi:hypothetical protein